MILKKNDIKTGIFWARISKGFKWWLVRVDYSDDFESKTVQDIGFNWPIRMNLESSKLTEFVEVKEPDHG